MTQIEVKVSKLYLKIKVKT